MLPAAYIPCRSQDRHGAFHSCGGDELRAAYPESMASVVVICYHC